MLKAIPFVALLIACTKPVPGVCCETEAECQAIDLAEPRPCSVGVCVANECSNDGCDGDEDCRDPMSPHCVAGSCRSDSELCAAAGGRIAFVSDRDGDAEVFVSYADGTFAQPITNNTTPDVGPVWSPTNDEIAIRSVANGATDVFVTTSSGHDESDVSNTADDETFVSWSRDGTMLAFVSLGSGLASIHIVTRAGSALGTPVTGDAETRDPAWGPGTQLVFAGGSVASGQFRLWTTADGGTSSNPLTPTASGKIDATPQWSPDGTRIAFLSNRLGVVNVWSIDATGANIHDLTNSGVPELELAWSPDGSKLAVVRETNNDRDVWVMNSDGSNPVDLTPSPGADEHPRWLPDGSAIVFQSNRDGNSEIYRVRLDGTGLANLTNNGSQDTAPEIGSCP